MGVFGFRTVTAAAGPRAPRRTARGIRRYRKRVVPLLVGITATPARKTPMIDARLVLVGPGSSQFERARAILLIEGAVSAWRIYIMPLAAQTLSDCGLW